MPPFLELSGKNIRNLKEYSISPSPKTNIIIGKNGAGKTNLLEAIYLNTLGRSFRTNTTRSLTKDNENACWVFARHQSGFGEIDKIGIERLKGNQQGISLNGQRQSSLAELAALIPTIIIQPSETHLIDGASQQRRKHLDWVLFHVEPRFLDCWRQNQKQLKQRNQLLRRLSIKRGITNTDLVELRAWDLGYVESCQSLSEYRKNINSELEQRVQAVIKKLPAFNNENLIQIKTYFYRGWEEGKALSDVLIDHVDQDLKKGFSCSGAHRSDFQLRANNSLAKDYLSRGQKKLLAMSMCLAQAMVLRDVANKPTIILLDDVFSEIDEENTRAFIAELRKIDTQLFISCLHTQEWVKNVFEKETKVFHVEQGKIEAKFL